jgi:quercetin dioxygenase-like cupin family protein
MNKTIIFLNVIGAISIAAVASAQQEPSQTATTAVATTEHKVFLPGALQWGEVPPGLPAGGKMTVLDGDPTKPGSFTVRLKAPAGYKVMPHTHPTTERVTVISGNARIGMGEKFDEKAAQKMGPGAFAVLPAGMAHFAFSSGETVIQIQSEGPFEIKYVNPSDDPRNVKR